MLKITYSQDLQQLANALVEECFFENPQVFQKRLIVVPHVAMQDFLVRSFLEHPRLQMLAGVTILPLHQAVMEIGECSLIEDKEMLPSVFELALGIEEILMQEDWFSSLKHSTKKIEALAQEIAEVFSQYGIYGVPSLTGWQKGLWDRLFPPFSSAISFLNKREKLPFPGKIYLFGFSELPCVYLQFFSSFSSSCYLFSPCALFWEEEVSQREERLRAITPSESKSHPLLSNWGSLGRKFLKSLHAFTVVDNELYTEPSSSCLLHQLQRSILRGEEGEFGSDTSLQVYSAPSKLSEVELLQKTLYELAENEGIKPQDVLVLVADMPTYLPFIKAIFQNSVWPIRIAQEREQREEEVLVSLLRLKERRYAINEVLAIISSACFQKHWQISSEEVETLQELFLAAGIKEDLEGHEHSWQAGIDRLLYGLTLFPSEAVVLPVFPLPYVTHGQIDLLNRFLKWFQLVSQSGREEEHKSIVGWISFLIEIASSHFGFTEEESVCVLELKKLKARCCFMDTTLFPLDKAIQIAKRVTETIHSSSSWDRTLFMSMDTLHLPSYPVIVCLGMDEELFPKVKRPSSLLQISLPYSTKEEQRYLLLEILMKANKKVIFSYERVDPLDGKEKRSSFLVEELQSLLKKTWVNPYIPSPANTEDIKTPFLLPVVAKPQDIVSITDLKKCARNSVQLYFNQALGLYFASAEDEEEKDFQLSLLDKALFYKEPSMRRIRRKEAEGGLPQGKFAKVAIREMQKTLQEKQRALSSFGLTLQEIRKVFLIQNLRQEDAEKKPALRFSSCLIEGTLEGVTEKGLIVDGEYDEATVIKVWPLFLIYHQFYPQSPYLLFTKDQHKQEFKISSSDLESYFSFYEEARASCCPFHARLAKFFFRKDFKGFEAALEKEEDPYFLFLKRRGAIQELLPLFHSWQEKVTSAFSPIIKVLYDL